ncbi:MAG: response regulator [Gemmatimonadetes bacterium]|nr:response regulator [Gemmatimonadota bacterium]
MAEPTELTGTPPPRAGSRSSEMDAGAAAARLLGEDRAPERATVYWIIVLLLVGGSFLLRDSPWETGTTVHTVMEVAATVLAFVVGSLALVRYYSRKQSTFLFIGTGFLGTAILDLYHAAVTSTFVDGRDGGSLTDISAWSWTASRLFLSLYLFVSLLAWWRESREEPAYEASPVAEGAVYLTAAALTAVIFVFFSALPLSQAYTPIFIFTRPGELAPALFFLLAYAGYLWKGTWRRNAFEHFLLLTLLINVGLHALYMPLSQGLGDAMFGAAHLLKIASYIAVLAGLMISVYQTFRREGGALEAVRDVNAQLAREITTRRDTENRLQGFLDTAHDLIQSTDREGRFVYVNRAWKNVLGYDDDDLRDLTLYDLVHEPFRKETRATLSKVFEGGSLDRFLVEYVAKDGRIIDLSGSATGSVSNGEVVATQGIFRDVTEQRRAERELAASRANLAALVENTGDTIWSIDRNQRLITFNSAFALAVEAQTGREPTRGQTPEAMFAESDAAFYRLLYERALGGERFSELKEDEVGGQTRSFEVFCNPIQEAGGITGAVMFGKDVTARVRAEEALRIAKEEAEGANQAKSQFLANMSHELRTPLNSVIGFANILIKNKKGHMDAQETGFLNRILANGRHLLSLINDILDLSKVEAGRMELEIEDVDLDSLVKETLAQMEGQLKDRPVALVADVPEAAKPIETDRNKLKQVIINLVGNALKFTHEGSVTVRVELGPDGRRPALVAVQDTGIGIPQDRLDKIFEAFQQAESGTARKYGGTGLGLTISRSICQMLGYDLDVESELGRGSTFIIRLAHRPHARDVQDEGASEPEEATEDEAGEAGEERVAAAVGDGAVTRSMRDFKVLVVDDEHDSRVLLTHYLEEFGCQVLSVGDATKGIAMARHERPDLITLDLQMPGMDGWEALRTLKDDPELREIPVVVVSIVAKEGRSRLLGAVDLLTKPVEREDLLRVLWRNLIRQRGGRVLVVDDDDDARTFLVRHLEEAGLQVRAAANGEEAMLAVEREAPDAIVLDMVMPVMDGLGFLDRLRENPYYAGLPVIVVTGKDLTVAERRELGEKASGVLAKGEGVEERLTEVLGTLFPLGEPRGS